MGTSAEYAEVIRNKTLQDFSNLSFSINVQKAFNNEEELKLQEQMAAELKKLRQDNKLLEGKVQVLEQLLNTAQEISKEKDIQISGLKKAIDLLEKQVLNDKEMIKNHETENKILKDEIAVVKAELTNVKNKNRSRNKIIAVISFIAGMFVRAAIPVKI